MADKENRLSSVMHSLLEGLDDVLEKKTVIGEPVIVGDTIIIPLSDLTLGCGSGSNTSDQKDAGSGGFFARMTPSAVLVMQGQNVRIVNMKNQEMVTQVLDMMPEVIDRVVSVVKNASKDRIPDEEAAKRAFPENDA
ncbi:MAG: GerW family sporulation protein [Lachnospiraceae bacterium]|nr:GerW family sporulation protein [Lachnospiraceae bacterium]MBR2996242.1 GerW family sporulation protein [Lachnospiraceae bacterium]